MSLSTQNPTPPTCRICLDTSPLHDLISPCNCKGSLQHVHESCLSEWIRQRPHKTTNVNCELCRAALHTKSTFRPLSKWTKIIRDYFRGFQGNRAVISILIGAICVVDLLILLFGGVDVYRARRVRHQSVGKGVGFAIQYLLVGSHIYAWFYRHFDLRAVLNVACVHLRDIWGTLHEIRFVSGGGDCLFTPSYI